MHRYLQVLGLKISAIGAKFANPSVHEQNFLDLLNSHYLELQNRKAANSTVDYSSWKKNLLDVRTLVFHGPSLFYMHAVLVPGSCCFQNTITSTATTQHQPQQDHSNHNVVTQSHRMKLFSHTARQGQGDCCEHCIVRADRLEMQNWANFTTIYFRDRFKHYAWVGARQ